MSLTFEVQSTAPHAQHLLIGYAVHYIKANGNARAKIFKLRTLTMRQGEKIVLSTTISLATMTTRRHFPGHHRIDAVINGEHHRIGSFEIFP